MAYTEASKRATAKYKKSNYKRIPLDVRIEEYERLKAYCDRMGEASINGFLRKMINEKTKED